MTDQDLQNYAHLLKIPNFRGVFMRDTLPRKPKINESGIINLDEYAGSGTHWVAYKKTGNKVIYFDSFGNLKPPREFVKYMKKCKLYFNYDRYQNFNTVNCGHLALTFLYNKSL